MQIQETYLGVFFPPQLVCSVWICRLQSFGLKHVENKGIPACSNIWIFCLQRNDRFVGGSALCIFSFWVWTSNGVSEPPSWPCASVGFSSSQSGSESPFVEPTSTFPSPNVVRSLPVIAVQRSRGLEPPCRDGGLELFQLSCSSSVTASNPEKGM